MALVLGNEKRKLWGENSSIAFRKGNGYEEIKAEKDMTKSYDKEICPGEQKRNLLGQQCFRAISFILKKAKTFSELSPKNS